MSHKTLAALLLTFYLGLAQAVPLAVGNDWPMLALEDQHDRAASLDVACLATVVFARDRKTGDWALEVIEKNHHEAVNAGRLALILDVSRMPAVVTSLFALPAFRARPFPIFVAREATAVADLPQKDGAVTVLTLRAGKVAAIDYAHDPVTLDRLLSNPKPTEVTP